MPGVVIELTTSALQGLSERTAKRWDRLGRSYSITLLVDDRATLKFDVTFFCQSKLSIIPFTAPIYYIKTLLISPLSQIIIKSRPCPEMVIND